MQPLINRRGGLLSHTLRRTKGKNRKIESKKRRLESSRDVAWAADIKFLRNQPVRASAQPGLRAAAGRSEQKESAWRRRVPAKQAIVETSKLSVSSNQLKMIQVSSWPGMTKLAGSLIASAAC